MRQFKHTILLQNPGALTYQTAVCVTMSISSLVFSFWRQDENADKLTLVNEADLKIGMEGSTPDPFLSSLNSDITNLIGQF